MGYPAWPAGRTCNTIISFSLTWHGAKPRTPTITILFLHGCHNLVFTTYCLPRFPVKICFTQILRTLTVPKCDNAFMRISPCSHPLLPTIAGDVLEELNEILLRVHDYGALISHDVEECADPRSRLDDSLSLILWRPKVVIPCHLAISLARHVMHSFPHPRF